MKNKILIVISIFSVASLLTACENTNHLKEIKIGSQIWTANNLDVSTFRNGDQIPQAKTNEEWIKAGNKGMPAWCHYDNNSENRKKYGKLYNWYTVNDPRGIAPKGWHIPSDEEWTTLTDYLGGESVASYKLREAGTTHWQSPNTDATNESGFTALPGGYRNFGGNFGFIGLYGYWWSSTEGSTTSALYRFMYYNFNKVYRLGSYKIHGFSVRCVRD